jgi:hypothetical protein
VCDLVECDGGGGCDPSKPAVRPNITAGDDFLGSAVLPMSSFKVSLHGIIYLPNEQLQGEPAWHNLSTQCFSNGKLVGGPPCCLHSLQWAAFMWAGLSCLLPHLGCPALLLGLRSRRGPVACMFA